MIRVEDVRGRVWKRLAAVVLVGGAGVAVLAIVRRYREFHRFDELIQWAAREHEVDAKLIRAIIMVESRFRPDSVGRAGEIGLMQVTPAAGYEWAVACGQATFTPEDLFDPHINIQAGTWYLARALRRWSNVPDPLPFALAEYNSGRANALRWYRQSGDDAEAFLEAITYPTTRRYVREILDRYR